MVIVSCDCYTSIPCVGGAPRSQIDLNVCGVFLLTFTLGDVTMLGTLASPESSPPGATHPLSLKTLISGGEKYCSVKSYQVLNSIFSLAQGQGHDVGSRTAPQNGGPHGVDASLTYGHTTQS